MKKIFLLFLIVFLVCCASDGRGADSISEDAAQFSNEDLKEFEQAVSGFELNWYGLETRKNPKLKALWSVSPWLEHGGLMLESDGFEEFRIPVTVDIIRLKLLILDDEQMQGIACDKTKNHDVSLDGSILKEGIESQHCALYNFRKVENKWKLSALFSLDQRSFDFIQRDWSDAPLWIRNEIGELPDNAFYDFYLFINS